MGIGYVQEVLARLQNHVITTATAQDNITLDNNTTTFPLNQTLYFDFSHDTNIAAILTAFGLTQFASTLPTDGNIFASAIKIPQTNLYYRSTAKPTIDRFTSPTIWGSSRH